MSLANLAQTQNVVTDIAFNKAKFDAAGTTMKNWSQVNQKLQVEDREKLAYSVVDSYSQMRVEEYVNFSKTFTPYMRWELHFVEAFSPANEDLCAQPKNQAAATECLNTWLLAGMREQEKPRMEACFVKAGCASNWMEGTPSEKKAFVNEY